MLVNLNVKNFALIEEEDVYFGNGINILTGETGAGKSIIIGSVLIALGEKVSKEMYINVPFSYDVKVNEAEKVIQVIVDAVKENENVINCRYVSVNEITTSLANYYINVTCEPKYKLQVRRDTLRTILEQFERYNIKVPFTQLDIHQK